MANYKGGCMCGGVRYEVSADPVFTANCHCRDCQRDTGSAYYSGLAVPKTAVSIAGEVKYYESIADSGRSIARGFCPKCGSHVFTKPSAIPELIGIAATSLDDPSSFKPGMDFYIASAQSWDYMNPTLPKFPKMPPIE